MTIGQRIKELRLKKGLSLQEVADRIGMSRANLSSVENGRIKNPTLETISRVAAALGYKTAIIFVPANDTEAYKDTLYTPNPDNRFL